MVYTLFHLKYIFVLQITSNLVTRGSLQGLTASKIEKKKKKRKMSQKAEKVNWPFLGQRFCSKTKEDRSSVPLHTFSQMTPS